MKHRPITLVQPDWTRFLTADGLAEKAGVPRSRFAFMILKELVDNAADMGGASICRIDDDEVVVADAGPGIDPFEVPRLFSVQRELRSSKHWRRGERGALGNGLRAVMGAVHVLGGSITVTSRGVASCLSIGADGSTVVSSSNAVPHVPGTSIRVRARDIGNGAHFADAALAIDRFSGPVMSGRPSPKWFDADAVEDLLRSAAGVSVGEFVGQFATTYQPQQASNPAASADSRVLLEHMIAMAEREPRLNAIGSDAFPGHYARHDDTFQIGSATLPFIVEVWVKATRNQDYPCVETVLIINRTISLSRVDIRVGTKGRLALLDGATNFHFPNAVRDKLCLSQSTDFEFHIAITAPALPILSSGKRPDLEHFATPILTCVAKAGRKAQAGVKRSRAATSVADVVEQLLPEAYHVVSDGGQYWANVRQLMYAMRPKILEQTGKAKVDDGYITGKLIPDFLLKHPEAAAWRIAYDARGSFTEPHTKRSVALGTVAVRGYRNIRFTSEQVVSKQCLFAVPPELRLGAILFVEKEGFSQNIEESGMLDRYDCALATTKGMSNIAIRALIDDLAGRIPELIVFTLTDFDIAGVTIEDTLISDGWRHRYRNSVRHVPLAVNWPQARRLAAQGKAEPSGRDNASAYAAGLARKGLPDDAVNFLTTSGDSHNGLRVELNAILPRDLVGIIRDGLDRHLGQRKVLPDNLDTYHRELTIRRALARHEATLRAAVHAPLPGLRDAVARALIRAPHLSWDEALAEIIEGELDEAR